MRHLQALGPVRKAKNVAGFLADLLKCTRGCKGPNVMELQLSVALLKNVPAKDIACSPLASAANLEAARSLRATHAVHCR